MNAAQALRDGFVRRFGAEPAIFRAPGRVNLIGEHTDYNEGFVLPVAIGFDTLAAVAAREDGRWRVHSGNLGETVEFAFVGDAFVPPVGTGPGAHWSDYVSGVARTMRALGVAPRGADLLVQGSVPLGSGLSSSASLEVAVALAIAHVAGAPLGGLELARACQRAENEFVGARCGIMDQYASVFGRAGQGILLDCRSLTSIPVPLPRSDGPDAVRLVVSNSMVRHALAGGEYNLRREQCERAVSQLAVQVPGLRSLRDARPGMLERFGGALDDVALRRARHVVGEIARTIAAAEALERGDLAALGALMAGSHASLRDDYEVSCTELDLLVELALDIEGVLGTRMTGGGFGGCTISLVRESAVRQFTDEVSRRYRERTGRHPEIHLCRGVDGACRLAH